jgi:hypothetical protein
MSDVWGVLARFGTPERLVVAAAAVREAGFAGVEAFTPYPVEDLAKALGQRPPRMRYLALAGGVVGTLGGYGMQVWANLAYRLDIGGRPTTAPQAFGLITFELMVLGAVLAMIVGLFLTCRLPRLSHPLFAARIFERATLDGYFLLIPVAGTANKVAAAKRAMAKLDPLDLVEVES